MVDFQPNSKDKGEIDAGFRLQDLISTICRIWLSCLLARRLTRRDGAIWRPALGCSINSRKATGGRRFYGGALGISMIWPPPKPDLWTTQ
jgi:hypothetical protein